MKSRAKLLACLLMIASVSGCAGRPAAEFCAIAKPIYMHPHDDLTDSTVDQIVAFDVTGMKLCGWRPPGK